MCFDKTLVLIKGAGDLATGVAYRLHKIGFPVVMTELPRPMVVRRAVSFAQAVFDGETTVEGIIARRVATPDEVANLLADGVIPVLVDPQAACRQTLAPVVMVDAIMAKRNTGTRIVDALLVIALGPGFQAGVDCHAVIETNRGHWLGRVIWKGSAQPNTGTPGLVAGRQAERVLRSPTEGYVRPLHSIGDRVAEGEIVATVAGQEVMAPFDGVLRGLIHESVPVKAGMKIGDVDPRSEASYCFSISEKSLAIGGGVIEAILSAPQIRERICSPRGTG
ncbi:MAG TPA: EF2563 family selenium-dependent molybdenum hydroxylase system protein [Anaerolineae bacterium]|nr:EF2563 family selenium-dependent molybdenum hydroxylase system protein [Anaerolineae bacterium]